MQGPCQPLAPRFGVKSCRDVTRSVTSGGQPGRWRMARATNFVTCLSQMRAPPWVGPDSPPGHDRVGSIESVLCALTPPEYHHGMNAMSGTVLGGKIVVEGLSLPDGTIVTVLTPGDDLCVRLPSHLEQELLDAIDEADKEAGGAGLEFLEGLKRYE